MDRSFLRDGPRICSRIRARSAHFSVWTDRSLQMTSATTSSRRTVLKLGGAGAAMLACPAIVRAAADQEILIANVVALTGANSGWGQPNWNGFQLACEMINAKGGIKSLGGAKLKPLV